MSTFEYISLEDESSSLARGSRHRQEQRCRLTEHRQKGRRQIRKSRRIAGGSLPGKRLVFGLVIIVAGTITAWGLQGNRSGEATWGRRAIERYEGESGKADLLMLVNKDHPLPETYEPQLHWLNNGSCAVAEEMYGALKEMLTDGSEEGLEFVVASGYRDAQYQQQLLDEDILASMESEGLTWEEAYAKETRETMPPGYSEHSTGLAADIVSLDYQVLDEAQEYTPENQWLRENCSKYGFILRYPRGAQAITGIDYESWHFRYVGKEAAQEIMERGITLEEFLGKA